MGPKSKLRRAARAPNSYAMRESRLRVAVVDDEETVRRALGRFFQAAGYDVETYGSGTEFLDAASGNRAGLRGHRRPPDRAHGDGRARSPGRGRHRHADGGGHRASLPGVVERALASGASVCLRKPLDGDTLLNAVTSAVHRAERTGSR